ncbi:hypothetical protein A0H81_11103 [Grifola frondosa]|uniref:Xylanolytic transcriptional activator regulatory domain-containing protein n=1 Tax=Grifola frondosa TaxID=5627 RepID=A0A1C7LWA9_GRIFR|nr:hypothetical protein A0H81_11103 [Grifola frondosa]
MERPEHESEASGSNTQCERYLCATSHHGDTVILPPSPAFNLTSQSMQNQIHELAKTLPPRGSRTLLVMHAGPSSAINCRVKTSVKQHCLSKNYPCTFVSDLAAFVHLSNWSTFRHHIQQATTEKKKANAAAAKRPRTLSASNSASTSSSSRISPMDLMPPTTHTPSPTTYQPSTSQLPFQQQQYWQHKSITVDTSTLEVISYLFSPPDSRQADPYLNGSGSRLNTSLASAYSEWGALAHQLSEENYRIKIALDLAEVFFQIVHTRLPLLNPSQFRYRLHSNLVPSSQSRSESPHSSGLMGLHGGYHTALNGQSSHSSRKPLHPALVATVVAWGAKFSEHPLFNADRERNAGQSLLAKTLINRARDLAEDMKVHRIPNADHVVIALLIEPLQSQSMEDNAGFHGFWLGSAIRLLLDLQINHKSVMANIQDPEARGTMIFAWWMACLADAYRSVYYRRKPMLDDDDYDIDFYTVGPVPPDIIQSHAPQPSPREQLEVRTNHCFSHDCFFSSLRLSQQFLVSFPPCIPIKSAADVQCSQGYYRAAHALARIARQMSRQLWRPATESDGVPLDVVVNFMNLLVEWRDEHLQQVGVPSNFEAEWDFVSAVTACASDATYHIMWIILCNALDDFGIREVNDVTRTGSPGNVLPNHGQIEDRKRKVVDEALHGALRIAGLVRPIAGVLASNGYLRLDSAVMHVSCIQAGTLLARLGRPEVSNCITGLEQYSYAYEECAEQAAEIKRLYSQAITGEVEFNHMASVVPRVGGDIGQGSNAMNVDQPGFSGYH